MPFDPSLIPIPLNRPTTKDILRAVPPFLRLTYKEHPRSFWWLVLFTLGELPQTVLMTFSLKGITDGIVARDLPLFLWWTGGLSLAMIWNGITSYGYERFRNEHRYHSELAIKREILKVLKRLPLAAIEHPRFSTLFSAFDQKRGSLLSVQNNLFNMVGRVASIVGFIPFLLLLPWQAVVVIAIFQVILLRLRRDNADFSWSLLTSETREGRRGLYFYRTLVNGFGLAQKRLLGIETEFAKRWEKIARTFVERRVQESHLQGRTIALQEFCNLMGFLAGLFFLVPPVFAGAASVGLLTAFVASFFNFSNRLSWLTSEFGWFQKEGVSLVITNQVFSLPAEKDQGKELTKQPLTITFEDVWFRYPDSAKDILKGVSFTFQEGDQLALIGLNGAGKSTLLKLLMRIYEPTKGRILVNGQDVSTIKLSAWRRALAVLTQDVLRFDDVLEQQIHYGDIEERLEQKRLTKALVVSGFDEVAQSFARGMKTHSGKEFAMPEDEAVELSGGQNQMLAIAQTVYRRARMYVFDEPTSAVDAEKEERFFESLPEAMKGKTVIFVSHRFSTLRRANRILLLESGKITEDGSHEALLAHGKTYARLFALQAKMYQ